MTRGGEDSEGRESGPGRLRRFYSELKRRRVIRISVTYLAGAFVIWQVADLLFEALPVPDWSLTLVIAVTIAGFPLAVLLAWAFQLTPEGVVLELEDRPVGARDASPPEPKTDLSPKRVAVLPFANLSGDPGEDYFSDGIMEELISGLARIRDLRVVSRTSAMAYKGARKTVAQIGRELGVGSIVEGSVRRSADRVRVVAQLIDARHDDHLWAETYDREITDIFELQSDVARRIAASLRARLSPAEEHRLAERPTESIEAFDLYLQAREAWSERTEEGLVRSVDLLDQALELDPDYAEAHCARADAFLTQALYSARSPDLVMPEARSSAERALALDPGFAPALAARGTIRGIYDWAWVDARSDFDLALESGSGIASIHQWRAMHLLAPLGEFEGAREALLEARSLDPHAAAIQSSMVFVAYLERDQEQAEQLCRAMLKDHPGFPLGYTFLGQILLATDRPDEAVVAFETATSFRKENPESLGALALALALSEKTDRARVVAAEVEEARRTHYTSAARAAVLWASLGESERAGEELVRARRERATDLIWAGSAPLYDPLRDRTDFRVLLGDVGVARGADGS